MANKACLQRQPGRNAEACDGPKVSDFVKIGGMDVTVEVAERLGYLTRDARTGIYANVSEGQIREASGEAAAARQQAAAEAARVKAVEAANAARLPNEVAETAAREITESVSPGTATRVLLDIFDTGNIRSTNLSMAATEAGIAPSDMGAKIGAAMKGFEDQARAFATERGVDLEQFSQWARTHHAGDLKDAMVRHVQGRDVKSYANLFDRYMTNLDKIDPQSILNAKFPTTGMSAYKAADGNVVLRMPGYGEMSWTAAYKAGLVGPHRRS